MSTRMQHIDFTGTDWTTPLKEFNLNTTYLLTLLVAFQKYGEKTEGFLKDDTSNNRTTAKIKCAYARRDNNNGAKLGRVKYHKKNRQVQNEMSNFSI